MQLISWSTLSQGCLVSQVTYFALFALQVTLLMGTKHGLRVEDKQQRSSTGNTRALKSQCPRSGHEMLKLSMQISSRFTGLGSRAKGVWWP
jgi:hypothetical protein